MLQPVNRLMERYKTEPEVQSTTKQCPECLSNIPQAATRCAFCTVEQAAAPTSTLPPAGTPEAAPPTPGPAPPA